MFHKEKIGWTNENHQIVEVPLGSQQHYSILPLESQQSGVKGLKISRGANDEYLYVDFRRRMGIDNNILYDRDLDGVFIYINKRFYDFRGGGDIELLDMTPFDDSFSTVLHLGQSFTDPATNTRITLLDFDNTGATIAINMPLTQCNNGIQDDDPLDGGCDAFGCNTDGVNLPPDFSCQGDLYRNDETNPKAQCQDGIDNDGDGKCDFDGCNGMPADPGCDSFQDNDEAQFNSCYDSDGGQVYDVAGYVLSEYGRQDDTCLSGYRVQEFYCVGDSYGRVDVYCFYVLGHGATCSDGKCIPAPQCNNHIDDDNDGKCDYAGCYINDVWKPADPDCSGYFDNTEQTRTFDSYFKNGLGWSLKDNGDIYLKTGCTRSSNCVPPSNNAFIIYHPSGDVVAYISQDGQMCIEGNSCTNKKPACNPQGYQDFVVYDDAGTPRIVIDIGGNLCYTGNMIVG
jgi:hypothetical protein